jgi:hypothetical protein
MGGGISILVVVHVGAKSASNDRSFGQLVVHSEQQEYRQAITTYPSAKRSHWYGWKRSISSMQLKRFLTMRKKIGLGPDDDSHIEEMADFINLVGFVAHVEDGDLKQAQHLLDAAKLSSLFGEKWIRVGHKTYFETVVYLQGVGWEDDGIEVRYFPDSKAEYEAFKRLGEWRFSSMLRNLPENLGECEVIGETHRAMCMHIMTDKEYICDICKIEEGRQNDAAISLVTRRNDMVVFAHLLKEWPIGGPQWTADVLLDALFHADVETCDEIFQRAFGRVMPPDMAERGNLRLGDDPGDDDEYRVPETDWKKEVADVKLDWLRINMPPLFDELIAVNPDGCIMVCVRVVHENVDDVMTFANVV